LQVQFIEY